MSEWKTAGISLSVDHTHYLILAERLLTGRIMWSNETSPPNMGYVGI